MIRLRVKIESNGNTFNFRHELPDDYSLAQSNEHLQALVQKDCDDSHCEEIQDVTLYVTWEW